MSSTMLRTAIALAFLACAGYASRLQSAHKSVQGHRDQKFHDEVEMHDAPASLASLLLALNPAAAFMPSSAGVRLPTGTPLASRNQMMTTMPLPSTSSRRGVMPVMEDEADEDDEDEEDEEEEEEEEEEEGDDLLGVLSDLRDMKLRIATDDKLPILEAMQDYFDLSEKEVKKVVLGNPRLLTMDVEEEVTPKFDKLKERFQLTNLLEARTGALRRILLECPALITFDLESEILPSLKVLQEAFQLSDKELGQLIIKRPKAICFGMSKENMASGGLSKAVKNKLIKWNRGRKIETKVGAIKGAVYPQDSREVIAQLT